MQDKDNNNNNNNNNKENLQRIQIFQNHYQCIIDDCWLISALKVTRHSKGLHGLDFSGPTRLGLSDFKTDSFS